LDYIKQHHLDLAALQIGKTEKRKSIGGGSRVIGVASSKAIQSSNPQLHSLDVPSVTNLEDDIITKEELKYNPGNNYIHFLKTMLISLLVLENMAKKWIEDVLGPEDIAVDPTSSLPNLLKSGVILCK
jgi:hypothetical protein